MAADYLLRFALSAKPCPPHAAAALGAGMLGPRLAPFATAAVEDGLERVGQLAAWRRSVSDDEWLLMSNISLLFACFEGVYRSRQPPPSLEHLDAIPTELDEWIAVACLPAEVEDVAVLGWAAATDHEDLRGQALRCNPEFAFSRALGGADGDIVSEHGLLIDLKTTSTRRVCSRTDLWQLCGYALADAQGEYGITAVGLSLLRWRERVEWPLDALISELSDGRESLPSLRKEFTKLADEQLALRRRAAPIMPTPSRTMECAATNGQSAGTRHALGGLGVRAVDGSLTTQKANATANSPGLRAGAGAKP